jgi:hypothetical protein
MAGAEQLGRILAGGEGRREGQERAHGMSWRVASLTLVMRRWGSRGNEGCSDTGDGEKAGLRREPCTAREGRGLGPEWVVEGEERP